MQYIPGPGMSDQYTVAGVPFVTASSTGRVLFPYVTQWVQVSVLSGSAIIGFTEAGLNTTAYFSASFAQGPSELYRWRIKELWISGSVQVVAGLTMVPPEKMWNYVHPPASGSTTGVDGNYTGFGYPGV